MRTRTLCFVLACLAHAASASAQTVAATELTSRIEPASAAFRAADPVEIRFTLTNATAQPLSVLKWQTPLEGIEGDIFLVTQNGRRAAYLGRAVKRPAPTAEDYVTIPPGQSVSAEVNLSAAYDVHEAGSYAVELRARVLDFAARSAAELASKASLQPRLLRSNAVTVTIAEPRPAPPAPKAPPPGPLTPPPTNGNAPAPKAPAFKNCSTSQQTTLTAALSDAQSYSAGSYLALAGTAESKRPNATRYTTWFGVYDATRYKTVTDHVLAIYNAFSNQTITFNCDCKQSWYAYVYPSQPYEIWLCNAFWTAPAKGTDCQFGTLIHETSHFNVVASTDDHVYGQAGCKNLASTNPANAIDNADSHEYFCENNPALSMGLRLVAYSVALALILAVAYLLASPGRRLG